MNKVFTKVNSCHLLENSSHAVNTPVNINRNYAPSLPEIVFYTENQKKKRFLIFRRLTYLFSHFFGWGSPHLSWMGKQRLGGVRVLMRKILPIVMGRQVTKLAKIWTQEQGADTENLLMYY